MAFQFVTLILFAQLSRAVYPMIHLQNRHSRIILKSHELSASFVTSEYPHQAGDCMQNCTYRFMRL